MRTDSRQRRKTGRHFLLGKKRVFFLCAFPGLDMRYIGWGFEDEDFERRCKLAGLEVHRGMRCGASSVSTCKSPSSCCVEVCCAEKIFSERLCPCAPFKEVDVSCRGECIAKNLEKLSSPEGRRNRDLFLATWSSEAQTSFESPSVMPCSTGE